MQENSSLRIWTLAPPIQFRLTEEDYADLQNLAIIEDATLNQISRYAVRLFIHDQKLKKKGLETTRG